MCETIWSWASLCLLITGQLILINFEFPGTYSFFLITVFGVITMAFVIILFPSHQLSLPSLHASSFWFLIVFA